jgi:hypothetical protein
MGVDMGAPKGHARKSLKILIAASPYKMVWWFHAPVGQWRERTMTIEKTCAACDYPLDANAIKVTIGGYTVEVCCDECAVKLNEAQASAVSQKHA